MNLLSVLLAGALGSTLLASAAQAAEPTKQECVVADDAAQALRHSGKLLAAREQLAVCVSTSCPSIVRDDCVQRLADVAEVMPSIVFAIEGMTVQITIDGQPILNGVERQVDPGEHRFAFDDGPAHREETIVVREGDHARIVRGALIHETRSLAPITPPMVFQPNPRPASRVPTSAIVAFSVGGAGLVLGTVFAAQGASAKSQANIACGPAGNQCPGDASHRNSLITTDTALAYTGFGIAAAGVAIGSLFLSRVLPPARRLGQVFPIFGVGGMGVGGVF